MTTSERQIIEARWRCRTDACWLANNVLHYPDVDSIIHRSTIDNLLKFPLPPEKIAIKSEGFVRGKPHYIQWADPYEVLVGRKRHMFLQYRGALKTTIIDVVHTIQWLLNFPEVAIMIMQATGGKGEEILSEVKGHFIRNNDFRELFPDYCPLKTAAGKFGTRDRFILPNRTGSMPRMSPSVMAASVDKGLAGEHFDVLKFSDIVEEVNTKTAYQLKMVHKTFVVSQNLLVNSAHGWIDVDGTRWHAQDSYGRTIESQDKVEKEGGKRIWQVVWQPVYKKQLPPGRKDYLFDAEEMDQPWLLGPDGKKIIWWPARNTHESLDTLRAEDPWLFAGQQLLNPVDVEDELKPFPIKYMHITPVEKFSCIPVVNCTTTVDTAETQSDTSSFTVITTCAWTASGCCYVIDVKRGRFQPSEIVTLILLVWQIYHPVRIAIEKTSFVRGLEVSLRRACDTRKIHLPIELIPRDNQTAKEDRILMTLQPWFKGGELRFLSNLTHMDDIITEFNNFPRGTDDILDTLADQFQNRAWFGRLRPRREDTIGVTAHLTNKEHQLLTQRWLKISLDMPKKDNRLVVHEPGLPAGL